MLKEISSTGSLDDIIDVAAQSAQLDEDGKKQLGRQPHLKANVCITKVQQINVLAHTILLSDNIPICQKP